MSEIENRRPLKSRGTAWANWAARKLGQTSITPNKISQAGIVFAAIAGLFFWQTAQHSGWMVSLFALLGALFCQLRLLCNLLDGMVAIEGGKTSPDGGVWNEVPDRFADIFILVGVGYGVGLPALGWAAAAMAIFTAYVREVGRSEGAPVDFSGPMAKPHRMAAITLGAVLTALSPLVAQLDRSLEIALWIVAIGAAYTAIRRFVRLLKHLRS